MNKIIEQRVIEIADYIINSKQTIRETAKRFNISKSTVHKDMTERLKKLDLNKYNIIEKIFENHIQIRHIKGGQSTKIKYLNLKKEREK